MVREVEARLKISAVDRTGNVLKRVSERAAQISQQMERYNKQQGMFSQHATSVMKAASRVMVSAGTYYAAKQAITSFAELERRITRIGLTAGATDEEMKASLGGLRQMAKDNALSFDQVAEGMETLVASGKSVQEAMAFLPSVLASAQASGAATNDIANTAIKTASALKIQTSGLQDMFDRMVYAGNLGQFELEDMARYIPNLANSFASLGYKGSEGLNELLATLQVLRADTGDAQSAATQAQNIFGKMYSDDMVKKFKRSGIDLRKELKAAEESGEGALRAFVRLTRLVTNGDLSKLGQLFTDQELRLGMQSLVTSTEEMDAILDRLRSKDVAGTVARQLDRVVNDTEAKLQRLQTSFSSFMENIGGTVAPLVAPALDYVSSKLDDASAISAGKDRYEGESGISSHQMLMDLESRIGQLPEYKDMNFITKPLAVREAAEREIAKYGRGQTKSPFEHITQQEKAIEWQATVKGMQPQLEEAYRSYQTGGRGGGADYPIPSPRGTIRRSSASLASQYGALEDARRAANAARDPYAKDGLTDDIFENFQQRAAANRPGAEIGTEVGEAAVQRFGADAAAIGGEMGEALGRMAKPILEAIGPLIAEQIRAAIASTPVNVKVDSSGPRKINALTGRSMPASVGLPPGSDRMG